MFCLYVRTIIFECASTVQHHAIDFCTILMTSTGPKVTILFLLIFIIFFFTAQLTKSYAEKCMHNSANQNVLYFAQNMAKSSSVAKKAEALHRSPIAVGSVSVTAGTKDNLRKKESETRRTSLLEEVKEELNYFSKYFVIKGDITQPKVVLRNGVKLTTDIFNDVIKTLKEIKLKDQTNESVQDADDDDDGNNDDDEDDDDDDDDQDDEDDTTEDHRSEITKNMKTNSTTIHEVFDQSSVPDEYSSKPIGRRLLSIEEDEEDANDEDEEYSKWMAKQEDGATKKDRVKMEIEREKDQMNQWKDENDPSCPDSSCNLSNEEPNIIQKGGLRGSEEEHLHLSEDEVGDESEDKEGEESEEDYEETDDEDDFELLDEDGLTEVLKDYEDPLLKVAVFNELVDTLEEKIEVRNNLDLHNSALQSLIVYIFAAEELFSEMPEDAPVEANKDLAALWNRLAELKAKHLPQAVAFDNFVGEVRVFHLICPSGYLLILLGLESDQEDVGGKRI